MKISNAGLEIIKKWEGLRLKAYLCPAGVPTIGYGHTKTAKLGMTITKAEAERLLIEYDVPVYEAAVNAIRNQLNLDIQMNQNQFDALVSLSYNIGVGALNKSTVIRRFRTGNTLGAANAFMMWVKGDGETLPGLVSRRTEERSLFLS